ncbi:transposase domain-containing protein, partial [Caballeronia humi]|uniref:transposase domain-containing protein n=1 Tax=Caballeronia humi TaxID=326474 RepID=UPI000AA9DDB3
CIADASDNELRLPARYGQNERAIATARKSWLFSDTEAGAKASAIVYSLMLTCRACGVEPHAWLLHVLTELPQRPPDADIRDLLPFNYAKRQAETSVS